MSFLGFGFYQSYKFYENQKIMMAISANYAECGNSQYGDSKACLDFYKIDLTSIFQKEYLKNTKEIWPFGDKLEMNELVKNYDLVNKKRIAANLEKLDPLDKLTKGHVSSVN